MPETAPKREVPQIIVFTEIQRQILINEGRGIEDRKITGQQVGLTVKQIERQLENVGRNLQLIGQPRGVLQAIVYGMSTGQIDPKVFVGDITREKVLTPTDSGENPINPWVVELLNSIIDINSRPENILDTIPPKRTLTPHELKVLGRARERLSQIEGFPSFQTTLQILTFWAALKLRDDPAPMYPETVSFPQEEDFAEWNPQDPEALLRMASGVGILVFPIGPKGISGDIDPDTIKILAVASSVEKLLALLREKGITDVALLRFIQKPQLDQIKPVKLLGIPHYLCPIVHLLPYTNKVINAFLRSTAYTNRPELREEIKRRLAQRPEVWQED